MSSLSPPALPEKSKQKKKHKDKGKSKAPTQITASGSGQAHGRNEGVDTHWAYLPPDGMVVLDTLQVDEEFDWDSFKDDENKEIWIMRVPEGFKTKHLDGLEIQQPIKAPGEKLSTLDRKRAKYDVWSVEPTNMDELTKDDDELHPKGEEIKNLSCLLPRKKKNGKLYIAPKQVSQHIIVTHAAATPIVDDAAAPTPSTRHSVPKHLLKHRFIPYGASSPGDGVSRHPDAMDVDLPNDTNGKADADGKAENPPLPVEEVQKIPQKKHSQSPEKTGKKRKNAVRESETPNPKSKKLKF